MILRKNQQLQLKLKKTSKTLCLPIIILEIIIKQIHLKKGEIVKLNIFFDSETFLFRLRYLGHETINTSFGRIKCIKFRPSVMAGRVFKEEESLTLWVTADGNKVPIKIKADS